MRLEVGSALSEVNGKAQRAMDKEGVREDKLVGGGDAGAPVEGHQAPCPRASVLNPKQNEIGVNRFDDRVFGAKRSLVCDGEKKLIP